MVRLARLVAVAAVAGVAWSRASAQISPGPLSRAHASLEGTGNCVKCHGLRQEPMSRLCLDCHKDIAWLVDRDRGLHAREMTGAHRECASCHPEHAGSDFALVDWGAGGQSRFDHARAGWRLEGSHSRAKCAACHTSTMRASPAAALSPRKRGAGWTGLETACRSCHESDDQHRGSLGLACERCHDTESWTKAVRFDHARTAYPLTGKHADVACNKCHASARLGLPPDAHGNVVPRYKPLRFAQCSACHDDPHAGRLSSRCSDCHSTRGFAQVDRGSFDHARTRFPLRGKHRQVACADCHVPGSVFARMRPSDRGTLPGASEVVTCVTCHEQAHREGTREPRLADCRACHSEEAWRPTSFDAARHSRTRLSLDGAHAGVTCASCHPPAPTPRRGARAVIPVPSRAVALDVDPTCESCHLDAHAGRYLAGGARPQGSGCRTCHDTQRWTPAHFDADRHAALGLPLAGAHAAVPCRECHATLGATARRRTLRSAPDAQVTSLRFDAPPRRVCTACHTDAHAGQFAGRRGGASCEVCHLQDRWMGAARFLHDRDSAFRLAGAHEGTPCASCHTRPGPGAPIRYRGTPVTCEGCHTARPPQR